MKTHPSAVAKESQLRNRSWAPSTFHPENATRENRDEHKGQPIQPTIERPKPTPDCDKPQTTPTKLTPTASPPMEMVTLEVEDIIVDIEAKKTVITPQNTSVKTPDPTTRRRDPKETPMTQPSATPAIVHLRAQKLMTTTNLARLQTITSHDEQVNNYTP